LNLAQGGSNTGREVAAEKCEGKWDGKKKRKKRKT
jgi:hypothetical protein